MGQQKKLALSPFFILLYIHLALNILLPLWFIVRNETENHQPFLHLAVISTFVLFIIFLTVGLSNKFSNTHDLGQVLQRRGASVVILILLLLVHFIVSGLYALFSQSWLCWVSLIDIILMIMFFFMTLYKVQTKT